MLIDTMHRELLLLLPAAAAAAAAAPAAADAAAEVEFVRLFQSFEMFRCRYYRSIRLK